MACRTLLLIPLVFISCAGDSPRGAAHREMEIQGGWLAPRDGFPLDSRYGDEALAGMRVLGVRQVAVGVEVTMPTLAQPALEWGEADESLRNYLKRVERAGMEIFLLPRIESPDFFAPPYPFRADIDFATTEGWNTFHTGMEEMILHYAQLCEEEGVALFGLGLELKHSVRGHADRWREIIAKVRQVFRGQITYSANWYDEWEQVEFWGELDFIGVGAYFELQGSDAPEGTATVAQLIGRWEPVVARLRRVSEEYGKQVLFTEVGYTGYFDCAERPWEWAGKQARGVAVDHDAQARAFEALLQMAGQQDFMSGMFVWTFYTDPAGVAPWEYGVQGRPAQAVLRRSFGGG